MLQRSKWLAGLFEREESMGQVMAWVLLPALLFLGACTLTLSPFPAQKLAIFLLSFGRLTTILFLETIHIQTVPKA